MKQITVAVIATMLLIGDKQQANLCAYSNKKVDETAATRNQQSVLRNADNSIQKDCIDEGEFVHEALLSPLLISQQEKTKTMSGLGKRLLSAFVDIQEDATSKPTASAMAVATSKPVTIAVVPDKKPAYTYEAKSEKFKNYFDQLIREANLPGPDYYQFAKMVEAMQAIPDERTRYVSAFAGLSVQGLDKAKLTESAGKYLEVLNADAVNFKATIDTALQEQVEAKKLVVEEKAERIQQLSKEITELNNSINLLGNEIKDNEEKIRNNLSGYEYEQRAMKQKISDDLSKINQLI